MILDRQNIVSDAQAVTTGNQVSTDAIDLWGQATAPTIPGLGGSVIKDVGRGGQVEMLIQVVTPFASGTSLQFQLIGATANDLTTGQKVYSETAAIAEASLVAGYQARLAIPDGIDLRFLGVRYVTVGTHTAGNVTAGIVGTRQSHQGFV